MIVSSPYAAEMVKLLEPPFRSVNIGLVNEVALMRRSLRANVWEIIDAAASKAFGSMPFYAADRVVIVTDHTASMTLMRWILQVTSSTREMRHIASHNIARRWLNSNSVAADHQRIV
jgi:UDP-glucose/GDP-mannose dehydrogenase family, central domain